eukprot:sb/3465484/
MLQKLQTVQNAISRKITGGHKHTQSATLTILAGLEPLILLINKERLNNYIHLTTNNNWWSDPNHGTRAKLTHSKDMENYLRHLNPSNTTDFTSTQLISFSENKNVMTNGNIDIYTDGSKMDTKSGPATGAGAIILYDHSFKAIIQPLAPTNTINQAELQAIYMVANKLMKLDTKHMNISIYTDSQTTLTRLERGHSNSSQLTSTINSLQKLQTYNNVNIQKVKAHSNVPGNEAADLIAKRATRDSHLTDNSIGLTKTQLMHLIKEDCTKLFINQIEEAKYARWTTTLLYKLIRDYPRLNISQKPHLRSLTLAISGQNNLNSAISHKDKSISPLCELCQVKENAEHKLLHCPDLDELRHKIGYQDITENILTPSNILDLVKFYKLITKSKLFE